MKKGFLAVNERTMRVLCELLTGDRYLFFFTSLFLKVHVVYIYHQLKLLFFCVENKM